MAVILSYVQVFFLLGSKGSFGAYFFLGHHWDMVENRGQNHDVMLGCHSQLVCLSSLRKWSSFTG